MLNLINIWNQNIFLIYFRKRQKRDGSAEGHSGAVFCLAWNRLMEHIMASGGADNSVILWDLEEAKPATIATHFDGMVIQNFSFILACVCLFLIDC